MALTRYERETIFNFNEEEASASIFTYNKKLQRRLAEYAQKSPDCYLKKQGEGFVEYIVPKTWIRVQMPRQYTEEQRREIATQSISNFAKARGDRI